MRRTRCLLVVPQAAYNPKYQPDPRQAVDPSMHKVVMRRQWVPKQWLLGEDPWEMDRNSELSFSRRNLADDYTDKIRSCLGFADALPYYLEMKERNIPPTTSFMNLYLAAAQRYKYIAEGTGRKGDVWAIFEELQKGGAKADINTYDLLRNTLHALCFDYCEAVSKEIVKNNHARLTAAVVKALNNVSEWSPEELKTFLHSWDQSGGNALMVKAADKPKEGYDILQLVASENPDGGKAVMALYREYLQNEQERRTFTVKLEENEEEQKQPYAWIRQQEREEEKRDLLKGEAIQAVMELLPASAVGKLVGEVFVTELTNEEVITGSVPRSTRTGKAFTDRVLPEWEAGIIVAKQHAAARKDIAGIRAQLLEGYNALCTENLHRLGQAINASRIDIAEGQANLVGVLNRYRSSLTALRDIKTIYNADHIAPLRSEILGMVSLPHMYSDHGDVPNDVVVGCYMEDDLFLPAHQRAIISPKTARVGLSYFNGLDLPYSADLSGQRRTTGNRRRVYDLREFCQQCDLFEPELLRRDDRFERIRTRRRNLGRHLSRIFIKREAARRDADVQRVFTASVERIIERGMALSQYENIAQIADIAFQQCFLWPNTELNHALLSSSAALPASESVERRTAVPLMVQAVVRDFDMLIMDARKTAGLFGVPAPEGKRPGTARPFSPHLADHPCLAYSDSGVDADYFGLYLRTKPWTSSADRQSDMVEVIKAFRKELSYLQSRWKESTGIEREEGGYYWSPITNSVEHVAPGDVPDLAARWEDRIQKLTQSPQTYDAMFQVIYNELVHISASAGTDQARAVNPYEVAEKVKDVVRLMHSYEVTPASTTFSLILSLCRRLPEDLGDLEKDTLLRLKANGKDSWWQWFEEL